MYVGSSVCVRVRVEGEKKRLRGEVPAQGVTSLGITGRLTTLVAAMGFASSEFVLLLLEHGADPYVMFKDKA